MFRLLVVPFINQSTFRLIDNMCFSLVINKFMIVSVCTCKCVFAMSHVNYEKTPLSETEYIVSVTKVVH